MSIIVKAGEQTQRVLIPEGNYVARAYRMIHVGTTYSEKYEKTFNQVELTWEFPTEQHTFNDDKGPEPFATSKLYTLSLHEKSTLRAHLTAWRGKSFTPDELKGFDITNVLGAYCMIQIVHNTPEGSDRTYANIASISSMPKGLEKPKAINQDVIFDFENNFDMQFVQNLPDFLREKIQSSNEYKDKLNQLEAQPHEEHMKAIADEPVNDLPF